MAAMSDFEERRRQRIAANAAAHALADPEARALIDAMKDQLLLVLVQRLGGEIRVPVAEVDGTGGLLMSLGIDGSDFIFKVTRKH